jgi:hypothetical protein
MAKKRGKTVALAVAAVLAVAVAGGWHWQNHSTKIHPKAGWAWGDDTVSVRDADSSLASD